MKISKQDREEATASLRELCPEGSKVYCIVRHVSRSGMSRCIDCYVIRDNELIWISGYASKAMGMTLTQNGIRVGGCGMNMCFALVYDLSRTLYRDGYKLTHATV